MLRQVGEQQLELTGISSVLSECKIAVEGNENHDRWHDRRSGSDSGKGLPSSRSDLLIEELL